MIRQPLLNGLGAGSSSSSFVDASRNVAQSIIRSSMRSVLHAIAEQNEEWLEPFVEIWCRHILKAAVGNDGSCVVASWLRNELDLFKGEDLQEGDNSSHPNPDEVQEKETDNDLLTTIDDPNKNHSFPKRPITAWAKLRRLGGTSDHILDPITSEEPTYEEKLQLAIAQLDQYGMTNQTYWLRDQWPFIERTTQQMRARLHPPPRDTAVATATLSSHHTQTWDSQLSQALLPPTQHPISAENNLPVDETMQQLVDRKRKSVNKKRRWNAELQQFVRKQKKKKTPAVDTDHSMEPFYHDEGYEPRPPSQDDGTAQLDWKRAIEEGLLYGWSVDDHVHSSTAANPVYTARLLGAVRELGHFHGYHQSLADQSAVVRPRDAIRARLGNHRPEEIKKQRPWSKVLRTLSDELPQQHWFDLDVGHCILENASDGTMYAFRSLEMSLRDEET